MIYSDWVQYNIEAEEYLLEEIKRKFGKLSKEYRIKVEQLEDLKNGR